MQKSSDGNWISQDTAMLVVHGIGHQNPLETLDQFARTLIESFDLDSKSFELSHEVAQKPRSGKGYWYDNFIRLRVRGSGYKLDIYEYYWANLTQDLAKMGDIDRWIREVAKEASRFYKRNEDLRTIEKGGIIKKKGSPLWSFKYRFFLKLVARVIPITQRVLAGLLFLPAKIPYVGRIFQWGLDSLKERMKHNVENMIGDIIVYNTLDTKSKYYEVRKSILDGAVSSLRYLIEPREETPDELPYKRVILAGHSLGSQISFDAVNRLTHHISRGNVRGYKADGTLTAGLRAANKELSGLVTFGSPLDKIAFFLWKLPDSEHKQYLRALILKNYHSFKQREEVLEISGFDPKDTFLETGDVQIGASPFTPLFNPIRWYNFYDRRDYVSGNLDFYDRLKNIDCEFESRVFSFTHSLYWDHKPMFKTIIDDFLLPVEPPRDQESPG